MLKHLANHQEEPVLRWKDSVAAIAENDTAHPARPGKTIHVMEFLKISGRSSRKLHRKAVVVNEGPYNLSA